MIARGRDCVRSSRLEPPFLLPAGSVWGEFWRDIRIPPYPLFLSSKHVFPLLIVAAPPRPFLLSFTFDLLCFRRGNPQNIAFSVGLYWLYYRFITLFSSRPCFNSFLLLASG